jgi:hypothetical protein
VAVHRLPILGFGTSPASTEDIWLQGYDVLAVNDWHRPRIARYGSSNVAQMAVNTGLYGGFQVPMNYVGSPGVVLVWTATVTTGVCFWQFYTLVTAGDDLESLDRQTWHDGVSMLDAAPSVAHRRLEVSTPLLYAGYAPGAEVNYTVYRPATDAADTIPGAALLFGAYFEYSDA